MLVFEYVKRVASEKSAAWVAAALLTLPPPILRIPFSRKICLIFRGKIHIPYWSRTNGSCTLTGPLLYSDNLCCPQSRPCVSIWQNHRPQSNLYTKTWNNYPLWKGQCLVVEIILYWRTLFVKYIFVLTLPLMSYFALPVAFTENSKFTIDSFEVNWLSWVAEWMCFGCVNEHQLCSLSRLISTEAQGVTSNLLY